MTSSKASAGDRPLVCLDETSRQLIAETRVPIPMKARRPARFDYEYERNGTANLFMMFAPLEGWRHVKVTPTPRPSHPSASTAAFPTNKLSSTKSPPGNISFQCRLGCGTSGHDR